MGFGWKEQDFTVFQQSKAPHSSLSKQQRKHKQQEFSFWPCSHHQWTAQQCVLSIGRGWQGWVWEVSVKQGRVQTVTAPWGSDLHRYTANGANPGNDKWTQFPIIYHSVVRALVHMLFRPTHKSWSCSQDRCIRPPKQHRKHADTRSNLFGCEITGKHMSSIVNNTPTKWAQVCTVVPHIRKSSPTILGRKMK